MAKGGIMKNKENLYCIIVFFENSERTYYGFNDDMLIFFKDLLNKTGLSYNVYVQINQSDC